MKLTKKEEAWLLRLEKCLASAPESLSKKVSSYTTGDNTVTLFDTAKRDTYERKLPSYGVTDMCTIVVDSCSEVSTLVFPFVIESTAG